MLTEEGSSDQSHSDTISRSVQLHTNTFLGSVNSSQLSKKTAELKQQLFSENNSKSQFNDSFDYELHNIHNPIIEQTLQNQQPLNIQQNFNSKLVRLSKNISLNEMVNQNTFQLNLSPLQSQISHLMCDFDDLEKENILFNYQKLMQRQPPKIQVNNTQPSPNLINFQNLQTRSKKSTITVTPIDQNGNTLQTPIQNLPYATSREKVSLSRLYPKQLKYSTILQGDNLRQSQFLQKTRDFQRKSHILTEENRYGYKQSNFSNNQHFRNNDPRQQNNHQVFDYKRNDRDKGFLKDSTNEKFGVSKPFFAHDLRSHRSSSSNIYQQNFQTDFYSGDLSRKRSDPFFRNPDRFQQTNLKYSIIQNSSLYRNQRYVNQFHLNDNQRNNSRQFQSPRFKDLKENQQSRRPVDYQSNNRGLYTLNSQSPRGHDLEKQQKKKRIREKAAQLLNRVKSQEYFVGRLEADYRQNKY